MTVKPLFILEEEMTGPITPSNEKDHSRSIIIASTIIILTCILSCAAVLIILIMRMS
jgi:hypothetical protein